MKITQQVHANIDQQSLGELSNYYRFQGMTSSWYQGEVGKYVAKRLLILQGLGTQQGKVL